MIWTLILIGLSIGGVISEDWTPMDPEEVAFEQAKCMEDHFKNDFNLVKKWTDWKLADSDAKTQCYVKCLVDALGIYDAQAKKFQPNNLKEQYQAYKKYNKVDQAKAKSIQDALGKAKANDAKCGSISRGFQQAIKGNEAIFKKIYLTEDSVRDAVYKANPQIKPKGISIFRFCGKKFYQDGEAAYCNVRRHGISDDPKFIQHSNCTTRGMRWMKKNGEMDVSAITRELHWVGVKNKDSVVSSSIKNCNVQEESKARDYYKCVYNGLGEELFMKLLDYIEVRSENYGYRLRKENSKYNADAMRQKVVNLDTEAKCPPKK